MSMPSRFPALFAVLVAGLQASSAALAQPPIMPPAPSVSASSFLLMDADTGKVIAGRNSHEPKPPASLTKVMTGFIAAAEIETDRVALNDEVVVSVNAWKTPGSRMFIQEGTAVTVEDLLHGMIVQSGNDASVALAEHIAGSESAFAEMMNQQAEVLGMVNSQFRNATGLPAEGHHSSAWDMALLTREYIRRFPENYALYAKKTFAYNDIEQPNRNRLLWRDRSVDGVKTGYTELAGYCLLASAVRGGMRLISVIMGADSDGIRVQESLELLSYGFRFYETKRLYQGGDPLKTAKVWYGESDAVELGVAAPVVVTLPRGHYDEVAVDMTVAKLLEAPFEAGAEFGELRVSLGGEELHRAPLVALASVAEAGPLSKLVDFLTLLFNE